MHRNRREVLPFTLTELFVLLFFVLALLLARETQERREAQEVVQENRELLATVRRLGPDATRELSRILERSETEIPDDFEELTRLVEQVGAVRESLQSALIEAGVDSTVVDSMSTAALADSLQSIESRSRDRYETLLASSSLDESQAEFVETVADSLSQLRDANTALTGQVAYLRGRIGNGLDHPPCWADEQGEIEYAFRAVLRTNSVDLRAIWPSHRSGDAEGIPGMVAAPGENLTHEEFSRRVLPVFAWSTRQEPECRHFVSIRDSVDGGKEAFKTGLLTVERFFYKRLEN